jgi:hypothetical protein
MFMRRVPVPISIGISNMIRNAIPALAVFLAVGAPALAQSFNVDIGSSTSYPAPSNSYGAAAAQPGVWQQVSANTGPPVALKDINNNNTSVQLSISGGNGDFQVITWAGDDGKLMNDAADLGGGSMTWTFSNLAAGSYTVFTYAEAPDFPATYKTNVNVPGSAQSTQTVGGAWSGSPHVLGVTYALHTITLAGPGSIQVVTSTPSVPVGNLGTCNGFQIRKEGGGGGNLTPFCFGDGSLATACPCANTGSVGHGCQNSATTGGAQLSATGTTSPDTVVLNVAGELPTALTIFLQGDTNAASGIVFGDGLRCADGLLKRIATKSAVGGATSYPQPGDPSITAASAALGDPIPSGATRYYQTYYRDPSASFCPSATFNASNGVIVHW